MTPSFLDAIKARLAAATPGPWEWSVRPKRHMLIHRFSERGHLTVLETQGDSEHAEYPCANEADRAFIEHAPSDIAALVAEVERLRAGLANIEQIVRDGMAVARAEGVEEGERRVVAHLRACVPPVHPSDYGHEAWTEAVRAAVAEERAAVVEWLRRVLEPCSGPVRGTLAYAADEVERGKHRREEKK